MLNVLIDDPSEVKVSFLCYDATFEEDKCWICKFCTICCSIYVSEKGKRAIYQFLVTCIRPSDRHLEGWMQWSNMGSNVRGFVQYYSTTTQDQSWMFWVNVSTLTITTTAISFTDIKCRRTDTPPAGWREYFTRKRKAIYSIVALNCIVKFQASIHWVLFLFSFRRLAVSHFIQACLITNTTFLKDFPTFNPLFS